MATTIQIRRDTAAAWTAANPTLAAGEIAVELDTFKIKVGNGSTAWNSLAYASGSSEESLVDVGLEDLPPGSVIVIDKAKTDYGAAGVWPANRPTSRTDICCIWLGDTDPGVVAIAGDIIDLVG